MMMNKFFRIETLNKTPIVIVTKTGWSGLIDIVDKISNKQDTHIVPISLWEFVEYIVKNDCSKKK